MNTPTPQTPRGNEPQRPPPVPAAAAPASAAPPASTPAQPVAPPTRPGDIGSGNAPTPDATGGVIPYKNPAALIAYYTGVFGLVPGLGLPLALAAIVLGIVGLRNRARRRAYGGVVHAWVGIVLGFASLAYHTASIVLMSTM